MARKTKTRAQKIQFQKRTLTATPRAPAPVVVKSAFVPVPGHVDSFELKYQSIPQEIKRILLIAGICFVIIVIAYLVLR